MAENSDSKLITAFLATRNESEKACSNLECEDYGLQAAAFASPPKWHLAHTTWFFETFILKAFLSQYEIFHPSYEVLFNSYYNSVGEQYPRPQRGLLSRPTVSEIFDYRKHVDQAMLVLLEQTSHAAYKTIAERCRLGIEHEKQHQELFYTDLKFSFAKNPLSPVYSENDLPQGHCNELALQWHHFEGGLIELGVDAKKDQFYFDNESPLHPVYISPFSLANRLVTNAEYLEFINDGGYQNPVYWLSDGWTKAKQENWCLPLYWREIAGKKYEYTLYGLRPLSPFSPVCHVSGYEADAYAKWAKARLPTEAEWEYAAKQQVFCQDEPSRFHPSAASNGNIEMADLLQLYDSCWQWTGSAYRPYPGFQVADGAMGEYNGKFMCNQWVLRGGSCVSSLGHLRPTYRNFFYPEDRWQFSGIRLAK